MFEGIIFGILFIGFAILYFSEKDSWLKMLWLISSVGMVVAALGLNSTTCTTSALQLVNGTTVTTYHECLQPAI